LQPSYTTNHAVHSDYKKHTTSRRLAQVESRTPPQRVIRKASAYHAKNLYFATQLSDHAPTLYFEKSNLDDDSKFALKKKQNNKEGPLHLFFKKEESMLAFTHKFKDSERTYENLRLLLKGSYARPIPIEGYYHVGISFPDNKRFSVATAVHKSEGTVVDNQTLISLKSQLMEFVI